MVAGQASLSLHVVPGPLSGLPPSLVGSGVALPTWQGGRSASPFMPQASVPSRSDGHRTAIGSVSEPRGKQALRQS